MRGIVKGGLNDGGSNIKSIQKISTTITNGNTTKNVTINAVTATKSIVYLTFYKTAAANAQNIFISAEITSSTNIMLTRNDSNDTVAIECFVVEFYNVKSKQTGSLSLVANTASNTASISSVDTSKSLLFFSYYTNYGSNIVGNCLCSGTITNATTLTFSHINTGAADIKYIKWQMIEFY